MKRGTRPAVAFVESGEHMYAGWMDVPVWFLACREDLAVPVEIQRMFTQGAKDAGANIMSKEIKSSRHCVIVSRLREVLEIIAEALAAFA